MIASMAISVAFAMGGWIGFGIASAIYMLGYSYHMARRAFERWRSEVTASR